MRFLQTYPAFPFIAGLAIITAVLFYVTSADLAALVMANLTSRLPTPRHDGAPKVRIFWALTTGLLTVAMSSWSVALARSRARPSSWACRSASR